MAEDCNRSCNGIDKDGAVKEGDDMPSITKTGLSRFAAIMKAEPGSALWHEIVDGPDRPGITEEEHRRIMSDPRWHG